jgi:hypothetical protein
MKRAVMDEEKVAIAGTAQLGEQQTEGSNCSESWGDAAPESQPAPSTVYHLPIHFCYSTSDCVYTCASLGYAYSLSDHPHSLSAELHANRMSLLYRMT